MASLTKNPPINPLPLVAKRWLISAAVVFGIYNPSGHSYYHWVTDGSGSAALKLVVGIFLLAAIVALVRMAFLSIGYRGIAAVLSLIYGSILFRVGLGWFEFADVDVETYAILIWVSTILGIGISWSFFQRRISGDKYVIKTP
jgi:hypothetical protein